MERRAADRIESKVQIFAPTNAILTDSTKFVVLPSASQSSISSSSSCSSEGSVRLVPHTKVTDDVRKKEKAIMRLGKNRLDSFTRYNFPDVGIPFEKLADAGFFCRKDRQAPDQVECIFCQVKISNWSAGMDPVEQHIRFSSNCEFVMGYQVNNVPVDGKISSDPIRGTNRSRHREPDIFGSGSGSSRASSISSSPEPQVDPPQNDPYGLRHQTPGHPSYVTYESRMRTFPSDWNIICPVPANRLAEAGFFYEGPIVDREGHTVRDAVTCYHCRRVLFNWVEGDDPWQEHKRLASQAGVDCYFLNLHNDRFQTPAASGSSSCTQSSTTSSSSNSPSQDEAPTQVLKDVGRVLGSLASSYERNTDGRCKVCYGNEIEILFLPCRHATCCATCASSVDRCPYCRAAIDRSVRIYLS